LQKRVRYCAGREGGGQSERWRDGDSGRARERGREKQFDEAGKIERRGGEGRRAHQRRQDRAAERDSDEAISTAGER